MAGFLDDIIRNASDYHQRAVDQAGEGMSALDEMVNPTIPQQIYDKVQPIAPDLLKNRNPLKQGMHEAGNAFEKLKAQMDEPGDTAIQLKVGDQTYEIQGNKNFEDLLNKLRSYSE
tara:strand:- start:449 stop:796 length:348 start_codon:yes stop_codon:yes gene_type:complete